MTDWVRLARLYGVALGAGLALEGSALLLADLLHIAPGDTRHNALHVVWGVAILVLLWVRREPKWTVLLVGGFGVFYTLLALLGVVVDQPFGLRLGPGENTFHFIVGPLALLLGFRAGAQLSSSSDSSAASESSSTPGSTARS